jgi:hypothetical protein
MQQWQSRVWIAALLLAAIAGTAGAQELLFPNSDFESGDLTNWTIVSGTAWDSNPVTATPWAAAPQGSYCVCSAIGAVETTVGVLQSASFTVPAGKTTIAFHIAGWSNAYHRVDVHLASDDSVVATAQVPATNAAFAETSIGGLGAYEGQDLYLTVHDENNNGDPAGAAGGWLAADNFHWAEIYEATGLTGNGNFETGDYTGWTTTGTAWGAGPVQGNGVTNGKEGAFFADSFLAGEPETGTLRSDSFEVTHNRLRFKMAGWPYWPPAAGEPTPEP